MKRIILRTFSSNDNFNGDFDLALIQLTPELLADVEKRRQAFSRMTDMHIDCIKMSFHDWSPRWAGMEEAEEHCPQYDEIGILPADFKLADEDDDAGLYTSEQDFMVVDEHGFEWTAEPKHSEVKVRTQFIYWKEWDALISNVEVEVQA